MNMSSRFCVILFAAMMAVTASFAGEKATPDDARAMVAAAVAHMQKAGAEKAFDDFTKDKEHWVRNELYVFAMDNEAVMKAHGVNDKLVGKSQMAQRDRNGKEWNKEIIATAFGDKGEGWVEYDWVHPVSKKLEHKASFVKRVPGTNYLVGVGIYR